MLNLISGRSTFQSPTNAGPSGAVVAAAAMPIDRAEVGGTRQTMASGAAAPVSAAPVPNPWPELQRAGLLMTAATVPGPIGTHLSAQGRAGLLDVLSRLDARGVHLMQRTDEDSDAASAFALQTPQQALEHIEAQQSTFRTRLYVSDGQQLPYPVSSLADVAALDALHFDSHRADSPDPPLTDALRTLGTNGFVARRDDSNNDSRPSNMLLAYKYAREEDDDRSSDVRLSNPESGVKLKRPASGTVLALDYFYGSGHDWGLSNPTLAASLRDLEKGGYCVDVDNRDEVNAFSAYTSIVNDSNPGHTRVQRGAEEVVEVPVSTLSDAARTAAFVDRAHELAKTLRDAGQAPSESMLCSIQEASPNATVADQVLVGGRLARLEAAESDAKEYYPLASAKQDLAAIGARAKTPAEVDVAVDELCKMLAAGPREEALAHFEALYAMLRARGFDDADRAQMHEQYRRLLDLLKSPAGAAESLDLLQIPAAGETPTQRLEVFELIADRESSETLGRTPADYRLVLAERLPAESLLDAGSRYAAVLQGLATGRNQASAPHVFSTIQKGTARQAFGQLDANAATAKFLESYLLNKDVELSLGHLSQPPDPSAGSKVERTDDGGIQIGPVKIPRRQS